MAEATCEVAVVCYRDTASNHINTCTCFSLGNCNWVIGSLWPQPYPPSACTIRRSQTTPD